MRLALIPPDSLWEMMELTDLKLLLPEQLDRLEQAFVARLTGYRILDNGAAEGKAYSINQLLNYVGMFDLDELVLPDVMYDCDETLRNARSYAPLKDTHPKLSLMGVAQGKDLAYLLKCITGLTHMEHIDVIGLPRWILSEFGKESRYRLAKSMFEDNNYPKPIHCLGANPAWPEEAYRLAQVPLVRSMDTSLPFVYGLKRCWLPGGKPMWREPDYFASKVTSEYQWKAVSENVRLFIEWTKAPTS